MLRNGLPPFQSFETGFKIAVYVYEGGGENPLEGTPPQYEQLYKLCWDENHEKRSNIISILETLTGINIK
ncbi:kinase-like protein [Gigaspora margarita]|uniref:Kinase-like protein n=1 Tax=Gigaspora margarita TaxID=4874 RepID=A0A8H4EJN9_GIGMA|nr:kinase-like protein [Gigaspora margarita]